MCKREAEEKRERGRGSERRRVSESWKESEREEIQVDVTKVYN